MPVLEDFTKEFQKVMAYVDNPFDQSEVAHQADILGFGDLADFCDDVSEDVYLLHAKEWYSEENL